MLLAETAILLHLKTIRVVLLVLFLVVVTLLALGYRKQVCVEKNIPQEVAVEHLLALIDSDKQ